MGGRSSIAVLQQKKLWKSSLDTFFKMGKLPMYETVVNEHTRKKESHAMALLDHEYN